MAKCMQKLVHTKKHLVVQLLKFLHVFIDEATIMDYHGWIVVSCVCGWRLEAHTYFIFIGTSVVGVIVTT